MGEQPESQESGAASEAADKDARMWGMLCHLSALAGYVIPLGWFLGPLVVWLIKKAEYPLVDREGKKALNFQITVLIAFVILIPFCFILIGIPLMIILGIAVLVLIIVASVKTSNGEDYNYPFSLKLFK